MGIEANSAVLIFYVLSELIMSVLSFFYAFELMCDASIPFHLFWISLLPLCNKTKAALTAAGVTCLDVSNSPFFQVILIGGS